MCAGAEVRKDYFLYKHMARWSTIEMEGSSCKRVCQLDTRMTRNRSKALKKDHQSASHDDDAMEGKSAQAFWSNLEKHIDEDEATLTKEWLEAQIHYFKTKRELLELEKEQKLKEMDVQLELLHAKNKNLQLQNERMEIENSDLRERRELQKRELQLRIRKMECECCHQCS